MIPFNILLGSGSGSQWRPLSDFGTLSYFQPGPIIFFWTSIGPKKSLFDDIVSSIYCWNWCHCSILTDIMEISYCIWSTICRIRVVIGRSIEKQGWITWIRSTKRKPRRKPREYPEWFKHDPNRPSSMGKEEVDIKVCKGSWEEEMWQISRNYHTYQWWLYTSNGINSSSI